MPIADSYRVTERVLVGRDIQVSQQFILFVIVLFEAEPTSSQLRWWMGVFLKTQPIRPQRLMQNIRLLRKAMV